LVDRFVEEREEVAAILRRVDARSTPISREQIQTKIERGFSQSEPGEVVDGDTFVGELQDMEGKRPG